MGIEIKELDTDKFNYESESVVILPVNYLSDGDHEYHSTTISFYKYAKVSLDIAYLTEPKLLVEQRSGEWFGPILLITSTALSENSPLISVTCGVIANYVTEFFRGQKQPRVRLKVLHKETRTSKLTEISYEGDLKGLDTLKDSIMKVASKSTKDE